MLKIPSSIHVTHHILYWSAFHHFFTFCRNDSFRSNCHPDVSTVLRQHYNRPYFLPADSESSSVDWIFMGGPGLGAFVHVRNGNLNGILTLMNIYFDMDIVIIYLRISK